MLGLSDRLADGVVVGAGAAGSVVSGGSGSGSAAAAAVMILGVAALLAAALVARAGARTGWVLAYRPSFSPD